MRNLTKRFQNAAAGHAVYRPWPYLPRPAGAPVANPAFMTPEIMARHRPGREVTVYAAGCEGLRNLAEPGKWSVAKVGVTATDLRFRLRQIGRDRYGSFHRRNGALIASEGFREWMLQPIEVTMALSQASPVRPENRGIRVALPATLSVLEFDRLLAEALDPVALDTVISSDIWRDRCGRFGLDPDIYRRLTGYDFGGPVRTSRAQEIAFFRPRLDGNALVAVIEAIIADHLVAPVCGEAEAA